MKKTLLGAALALVVAAPAAQACTLQELSEKAQRFAQKWQEVVQKDMAKAQRFAPKAQEASQKYQESISNRGQSYEAICRFYDELLQKLEKS